MRERDAEIEDESADGEIKFRFPNECGDDICMDGDKLIYGIGSFLVILFVFDLYVVK